VGLDVFYLDNDKEIKADTLLWSIDDHTFAKLSDLIIEFKRRTGLLIDQYNDLEILNNNLQPLIDSIDLIIKKETFKSEEIINLEKLIEIVNNARKLKYGVAFIGD